MLGRLLPLVLFAAWGADRHLIAPPSAPVSGRNVGVAAFAKAPRRRRCGPRSRSHK
jgi:hypothetical protein